VVMKEKDDLEKRRAEAEVLRAAAEQRAEELGEAAQTPPRRPRKSESLDAEYEQVMAMLSPMPQSAGKQMLEAYQTLAADSPGPPGTPLPSSPTRTDTLQELQAKADACILSRNYHDAEELFVAALELQPDDPDLQEGLASARSLLKQQPFESPRKPSSPQPTDRSMSSAPLSPGAEATIESLHETAQAFFSDKDYTSAIEHFRMGLIQDPENTRLSQGLAIAEATRARVVDKLKASGKACASAGDHANAAIHFQEALKYDADDSSLKEALGVARAHASARLQPDTGADQRNPEAKQLQRAGEIAFASQQYSEAVQHFTAAAKLDPTDAEVQEALELAITTKTSRVKALTKSAGEHRAAHRFNEAVSDFEEAASIDGDDVELTEALAVARTERTQHLSKLQTDAEHFLSTKEYTQAVREFTAALAYDPTSTQLHSGLTAAKAAIERIVQKNRMLGENCLAQQDWHGALEHFEAALVYDQFDERLLNGQSRAEHSLAVEQARNEQQLKEIMQRGETAFAAKDYADAVGHFSHALELHPEHPEALESLSVVNQTRKEESERLQLAGAEAFHDGRFGDAVAHLREASTFSEDPAVSEQLEQVLAAQAALVQQCQSEAQDLSQASEFGQAVERLAGALKHDPHNPQLLRDLEVAQTAHREQSEHLKRTGERSLLDKVSLHSPKHLLPALMPAMRRTIVQLQTPLHRRPSWIRKTVKLPQLWRRRHRWLKRSSCGYGTTATPTVVLKTSVRR